VTFDTLISGVEVYLDKHLSTEMWVRLPRLPKTKKRRIRNKWLKRYPQGKWVPNDKVYMIAGRMVMHPSTFAKLNMQLKEGAKE